MKNCSDCFEINTLKARTFLEIPNCNEATCSCMAFLKNLRVLYGSTLMVHTIQYNTIQLDDLDKVSLKARLKKNATIAAFKFLKLRQSEHKKVKHIQYKTFEVQSYLRSATLHLEEMKTLTTVRSVCLRNIRSNFSKCIRKGLIVPSSPIKKT